MNTEIPVTEPARPVRTVQLHRVILPLLLASITSLVLLGLTGYQTKKSTAVSNKASTAFQAAITQAKLSDSTANSTLNPGTAEVAAANQAALAATTDAQYALADYWMARGFFWEGNNLVALDYANKSLVLGGGLNSDTLVLVGQLNVNVRQFDAAVTAANQVLALIPNDPRGYRVRAFAEFDQGATSLAARDISHTAELDVAQGHTELVQSDANDQVAMQSLTINYLYFKP